MLPDLRLIISAILTMVVLVVLGLAALSPQRGVNLAMEPPRVERSFADLGLRPAVLLPDADEPAAGQSGVSATKPDEPEQRSPDGPPSSAAADTTVTGAIAPAAKPRDAPEPPVTQDDGVPAPAVEDDKPGSSATPQPAAGGTEAGLRPAVGPETIPAESAGATEPKSTQTAPMPPGLSGGGDASGGLTSPQSNAEVATPATPTPEISASETNKSAGTDPETTRSESVMPDAPAPGVESSAANAPGAPSETERPGNPGAPESTGSIGRKSKKPATAKTTPNKPMATKPVRRPAAKPAAKPARPKPTAAKKVKRPRAPANPNTGSFQSPNPFGNPFGSNSSFNSNPAFRNSGQPFRNWSPQFGPATR